MSGAAAREGKGPDSDATTPLVPFVIKGAAIGREPENGPQRGEALEDEAFALNATEVHAVAFAVHGTAQATRRHAHEVDATGAVQHKGNAASGNEAGTLIAFVAEAESGNGGNGATMDAAPPCRVGLGIAVGGAVAVRRLTPRECERLQGMPDDHTLIEWRGKPAPDSLRYKAIGNAVAVPVVAWIAERLRRALR